MSKLWYQKPAAEWEEALPLGNGRVGAMVYGGTDRELLQVNEESMWYGGCVDRLNPDAKENLPRIRKYLEEGSISKAEKLMEAALSGCPDSMHSYQTLGEVQFFFDNMPNARERKSGKIGNMVLCEGMTEYERSLSLDTAVAECRFRSGNTLYKREYFASHPADCIFMRFSAEGEGTVDFLARLRRGKCFDGVKKLGDNESSQRDCLILQLSRSGKSVREIASQVNCGKSTVSRIIQRSKEGEKASVPSCPTVPTHSEWDNGTGRDTWDNQGGKADGTICRTWK